VITASSAKSKHPPQNDDSIPLRSSKKTGAKSKKEVREQVLSNDPSSYILQAELFRS
jgi:hypothetical protein